MTHTIQNSEGVETLTPEQYGFDAFQNGCDRVSPYPPSPRSVMWYAGYDTGVNAQRLRHSLAREPATADVERAVAQLRRWEDETPIYAGNDPRADYYRQRRETIRLAIAALTAAALRARAHLKGTANG